MLWIDGIYKSKMYNNNNSQNDGMSNWKYTVEGASAI